MTEQNNNISTIDSQINDRPFDVTHFEVVHDQQNVSHILLSPLFETLDQARHFLAEIKSQYPNAYCIGTTSYFSSENDKGRQALLDHIRKSN